MNIEYTISVSDNGKWRIVDTITTNEESMIHDTAKALQASGALIEEERQVCVYRDSQYYRFKWSIIDGEVVLENDTSFILEKVKSLMDRETSVVVFDEPTDCGASHEYGIAFKDIIIGTIYFQKGPIKENGVNGVTQEDLLEILIHRLEGFQKGPFACEANAKALQHIEEALGILNQRTAERISRGVEGRNVK